MISLDSLSVQDSDDAVGVAYSDPAIPDVTFRIRPLDYPPYVRDCAKEAQRILAERGSISGDDLDIVNGRLLAEHILVGWQGLDKAYTKELAIEILVQPKFRRLREFVEAASRKIARISAAHIEGTSKN